MSEVFEYYTKKCNEMTLAIRFLRAYSLLFNKHQSNPKMLERLAVKGQKATERLFNLV